jgi:hypothetical protein
VMTQIAAAGFINSSCPGSFFRVYGFCHSISSRWLQKRPSCSWRLGLSNGGVPQSYWHQLLVVISSTCSFLILEKVCHTKPVRR